MMSSMNQLLGLLLFIAIIFLGFFLWERAQPEEYTDRIDNAQTSDRCAEFRQRVPDDEGEWSLGYGGRIRQLLHGCF